MQDGRLYVHIRTSYSPLYLTHSFDPITFDPIDAGVFSSRAQFDAHGNNMGSVLSF